MTTHGAGLPSTLLGMRSSSPIATRAVEAGVTFVTYGSVGAAEAMSSPILSISGT
jgi:hypothetical protein